MILLHLLCKQHTSYEIRLSYTAWFILGKYCTSTNEELCKPMDLHTKSDMLFFMFPPYSKCFERPATPFQLGAAVAFWASVWSASLFPVQTESHRRKLCLPSWAPQSEPCEVSRPQRHMFGISASIRIEHSRYMLKEPNPHRPKQKHAHINMIHPMPSPAVWAYSNKLISTDPGKIKNRSLVPAEVKNCLQGWR